MALLDAPKAGLVDLQRRKLMKLFTMYDATNTGMLTIDDFQDLVDRLAALKGLNKESSDYIHLMDKMMHRWIHLRSEIKNSVGTELRQSITLEEWLSYFEKVLGDEAYRDHIRQIENLIFEALDTDASGVLDFDEWKKLFQVYGIPVIYAQEAFNLIDQDHDGSLAKTELLPLIEDFYYSQDPNASGNFIFGPC